MIRVGVIGARRVRQGLGSYVVRDLRAAGAQVPCFLATSAATRDVAARELRQRWGVDARGYLDLGEMITAERPDALAICSPAETHETYLAIAAAAGVHALCEKPLLWGRTGMAARAAELVASFEKRGLVVWENCLWPYTLPAFRRLHPDVGSAPPRRFEMSLQPGSRGAKMLGDSVPHALSLLQALAPDPEPRLERIRFSSDDAEATHLEVGFRYRTRGGVVEAHIELEQAHAFPRQVRYAIDGRGARRLVSPESYRLCFCDGGRSVPVDDPLGLLVADFVRTSSGGGADAGSAASRRREIVVRMELLETIATAFVTACVSRSGDRVD